MCNINRISVLQCIYMQVCSQVGLCDARKPPQFAYTVILVILNAQQWNFAMHVNEYASDALLVISWARAMEAPQHIHPCTVLLATPLYMYMHMC